MSINSITISIDCDMTAETRIVERMDYAILGNGTVNNTHQ
jgi:hypothetical protein